VAGLGKGSLSGPHMEGDVVSHMVVVGMVGGSHVGSCCCLSDGHTLVGVVNGVWGCASTQGGHGWLHCCDQGCIGSCSMVVGVWVVGFVVVRFSMVAGLVVSEVFFWLG